MSQQPNYFHRRTIRLKGYDYSQEGLYYITICIQNRECLFGDIIAGKMILNDSGKMVEKRWLALTDRFPNVQLHEFVVMPDHFHAILEILPTVGAYPCGCPLSGDDGHPKSNGDDGLLLGQPQGHAPTVAKRKTVGDMMDAFKSITTVEYIRGVKNLGWTPFNGKLWQRNYYEHIIRDYDAFVRISEYIRENLEKWKEK